MHAPPRFPGTTVWSSSEALRSLGDTAPVVTPRGKSVRTVLLPRVETALRVSDWLRIQGGFDEVNKNVEKIERTDMHAVARPRMYFRMLTELDEDCDKAWSK